MAFVAGQKVRASQLNAQGVIKARARRVTNTGASTGSVVGILRLDDVPVVAGRAYQITAIGGLFPNATDNVRIDATLRYTTNGATPTTASPILVLHGLTTVTNGYVERYNIIHTYVPGVDQTLSLIMCFQSVASGGAAVSSYAAADWPTEIIVTDMGADPGDTGVDI